MRLKEESISIPLRLIPLQFEQHYQLCSPRYWPSPETNKIHAFSCIRREKSSRFINKKEEIKKKIHRLTSAWPLASPAWKLILLVLSAIFGF
jgi:hypothetical protein